MLALVNGNFQFRAPGRPECPGAPGFMPLGLLSLQAYAAEHATEEIQVLSPAPLEAEEGARVAAIAAFLDTIDARAVGISVTALSLPAILLALRRRRRRDQHVILGGPAIQGLPEAFIDHFPEVDVVVRGEGEIPLVAALRRLDGGDGEIPGATYRAAGRVVRSRLFPRLPSLDEVPPVFWTAPGGGRGPVRVLLESSRGCPFRCAFCSSPGVWGNRVTHRSPARIVAALEELAHRGDPIQAVFVDDLFTLSRRRVLDLCARLRRSALPLRWVCFGRVETVDETLLDAMAAAGCAAISFGIESGDDRVLAGLDKRFTTERARRVVRAAAAALPLVETSFIRGFPFETPEQFGRTVDLMSEFRELGCHAKLYTLTPLLGTTLHRSFHDAWRWRPSYRNPSLQDWYPLDPDLLELLARHPYLAYPYGFYEHAGRRAKERMTPAWPEEDHALAGARRSARGEPGTVTPGGRSTPCPTSSSTSASAGGA